MDAQPVRKQNGNHIILWFLHFECSPQEITEALQLQPTGIRIKGQIYSKGDNFAGRVQKFSYWEYEWTPDSTEFIGTVAERFISEVIKPRAEAIKALSTSIASEFKIVQYYYEGFNPGYHFSVEAMKILVDANLEVDIDVYCLSEDTDE